MGYGIFLGRHRISVTEKILPYLMLSSPSSFTLKASSENLFGSPSYLYYSQDNEVWTNWTGTEISSGADNKLYIRGEGQTRIAGSSYMGDWRITGSNVSLSGNLDGVVNWQATALNGCSGQNVSYKYMFARQMAIVSAKELIIPSAYNCQSMFNSCTNLVEVPQLPATTLTRECYAQMFYGCTSLTAAPALPATTLTEGCYRAMFYGCTALTAAPALPATTLATNCYREMFQYCTSLTTAPALPATTLATNCYGYMFNGCSMIKLSKTQDSTYKYAYRIPMSGTGTTASNALGSMFSGTGGSFTGTPSINTTYYTANEIVYP